MKVKNLKKPIKNTGLFLILGFALAACQTTAKVYPLKTEDVRTFSLQAVNVTIPSEAKVQWGRYKKDLELIKEGKPVTALIPNDTPAEASSTSSAPSDFSAGTNPVSTENAPPKFKKIEQTMTAAEYQKAMITDPIRKEIRSNFSQFMRGDRAVRAEVALENLYIAKANGKNYLTADFTLYDVGTNSKIMSLNNHAIEFQPTGRSRHYYGTPIVAILATAIDAAARAAISQASKHKRVTKMSVLYAASVRDNMAADLKPKK